MLSLDSLVGHDSGFQATITRSGHTRICMPSRPGGLCWHLPPALHDSTPQILQHYPAYVAWRWLWCHRFSDGLQQHGLPHSVLDGNGPDGCRAAATAGEGPSPPPPMPLWSHSCNSGTFPVSFCLRAPKEKYLFEMLNFTLGSQRLA